MSRWSSFIKEITINDDELPLFIQQMFGYCLSRSTEMECLFILYRSLSSNCKSTVIETIGNIVCDYFKKHLTRNFRKV